MSKTLDVLNVIALFSNEQYESLSVQDPRYQLISYNDGSFNRSFSFDKDSKIAVYLLNNPDDKDITISVKK